MARARVGIVKQSGGNSGKAVKTKAVGPKVTKRSAVRTQKPVGVDPGNPHFGINTQNLGVNVGSPGRAAGAVTQRIPKNTTYPKAKRTILGGND